MRSQLLAAAALLVSSFAAHAVPITYTETDTGSGRLGANTFTDALITVSFTGDTSTVTGSPGFYANLVGIGTVQVGTGAVATLTDAPEFFDNQMYGSAVAGIGSSAGSILDTFSYEFETYTGRDTFGPVTGPVFYQQGGVFTTTEGNFSLNFAGDYSTFTATLGSSVTPEPSSFALLGTGLLGVAGMAKRRLR